MSKQIALEFINAINSHDVKHILSLMSTDHSFVDAYGARQSGEEMKQGWPGYFKWFPDYHIEVEMVLEDGDTVGVFGFAEGTFQNRKTPDNRHYWRLPAAWKVVVDKGKVKVWQVFCDSKIPYDTMNT